MTRLGMAIAMALFLAECGAEYGPSLQPSGRVTGALSPAPLVNAVPKMDKTWKDTVPAVQPMLKNWTPADYCPVPDIDVHPGIVVTAPAQVMLSPGDSYPGTGFITNYLWSVHQPPENAFNLVPSMSFVNPVHQVGAPGIYWYCLDVWDEAHDSQELDCLTTACVEVHVVENAP